MNFIKDNWLILVVVALTIYLAASIILSKTGKIRPENTDQEQPEEDQQTESDTGNTRSR